MLPRSDRARRRRATVAEFSRAGREAVPPRRLSRRVPRGQPVVLEAAPGGQLDDLGRDRPPGPTGALVVLSACESGSHGRRAEPVGIGWAFLAAGAAGVLVSHWPVDDAATATLMSALYEHLSAGEPPDSALRLAQLHAAEFQPHPFYWEHSAIWSTRSPPRPRPRRDRRSRPRQCRGCPGCGDAVAAVLRGTRAERGSRRFRAPAGGATVDQEAGGATRDRGPPPGHRDLRPGGPREGLPGRAGRGATGLARDLPLPPERSRGRGRPR